MQMREIGTGFLTQKPPRGPDGVDRLIGQMSMSEVRAYMCPKSHGNPKKCENCDGFRTCEAGQRAVRLAHEEELKEPKEPEYRKVLERDGTNAERDEFRTACESGNAWNWYMTEKRLSRDAAGDLLTRIIRKFPGIAAEYGGSRRIMQRPRVVTITSIGAQEEAPATADRETPTCEKESRKTASSGPEKGGAVIRERTIKKVQEVFASADPIAYVMQTDGVSQDTARKKIIRWMIAYPEIAGDYRPPGYKERKKWKKPEEAEEKAETKKPENEDADDSEISLEDFLSEFDEAEADRREAELNQLEEFSVKRTEEPPEPGNPAVLMPETWKGTDFADADLTDPLSHMRHRAKYLEQERGRMMEIIRQAEEKIAWIDERLAPLLIVIENW